MTDIEYGWYLPTHGDTTAFNDPSAVIRPTADLMHRVVAAAEGAGFTYLLIPVGSICMEAYMAGAFVTANSKFIKPLIAARPGFMNPVLAAKMIATFDVMSGGRISINLIAGQADKEVHGEGVTYTKEQRYALMREETAIMKALWTQSGGVDYDGDFHKLSGARAFPRPLQKPYPRFYLGGGSEDAAEMSAEHSDVHLFWGDLPESIAKSVTDLNARATKYDRRGPLEFGMRLQIVCRETEAEAWSFADGLVANTTEADRTALKARVATSQANARVQALAASARDNGRVGDYLWTGMTRVRPGAGVAVVGSPDQVANQLQQFIDAGCTSFCLSGYLHDEEAERFGRLVRPLLDEGGK
jgi:alkanesulfonate monooxygenase